ncbi:MAG: alpha/beta hydrolase [Lachnospiraceae bacterium]|nr:alpha/beta hydrolase [Lachnospiraceae bacterium]
MPINGSVSVLDTEMYYVSFGKGKKDLVVLPGLSDGLTTVKGKAKILSIPYRKYLDEYTVYMFSRKNDMPEGYSIRDMARDQVIAMKNLGIEKADLMGVSQGGMISQYIAIDYPEMIDKLILVVTAPYANETVKTGVGNWMEKAEKGDYKALMIDTAEKMYSDEFLDKNRRYFPIVARFTKPKSFDRFLVNANAIMGFDAREEISRIVCPTLIIAGDNDRTVGNEGYKELNQAIADSRLHIYKGLGHGAFEEAKDFYDVVLNFCNED